VITCDYVAASNSTCCLLYNVHKIALLEFLGCQKTVSGYVQFICVVWVLGLSLVV